MRNILALTHLDLKRITRNVMACVVVFGLVIIPALFTWFNVIASWDPFSETRNLKIALANTDDGYQSDLIPIRINVGDQVVTSLQASDEFDWVVTSKDEAIDGTKSGEYYAAIVLPPDFSASMLTFFSNDDSAAELQYYTNQKLNALAPTITGQGAESVLSQIDRTFAKKLSDVALGLLTSLSDFLTDGDTKAVMNALSGRAQGISDQLRAGAGTADLFTTLIGSSIPLVQGGIDLVESSQQAFGDTAGAVKGGLAAVDDLRGTLQTTSDALKTGIDSTIAGYQAVGEAAAKLFSQTGMAVQDQASALDAMAARVQVQIDQYQQLRDKLAAQITPDLPPLIQRALQDTVSALDRVVASQQGVHDWLAAAATAIRNDAANTDALSKEIKDALQEATSALTDAKDAYSATLKPKLDSLVGSLAGVKNDVSGLGEQLDEAVGTLVGTGDGIEQTLTQAQASMDGVATKLRDAAAKVDKLQAALAQAATGGDLSAVQQLIGSDPSALAAAVVHPVQLERVPVYPVVSFGAAMSPLYTALALWVGALLMTVAIHVGVGRKPLPGKPDLTNTQKYLGRYGIFAIIGLAQSLLLTVGLVLFVQIQAAHPFLFILAGLVTSLVFTLLLYTLVVAIGNAGKAVGVLFLVIQISGAGGAYPLPLLPHWFQSISPFLPATHAINAMRSAIAGTYQGDYWTQLGLLALFVPAALLVGLVLRRPLIGYNKKLMEAIESTKLM